jgi:hypothetical protein
MMATEFLGFISNEKFDFPLVRKRRRKWIDLIIGILLWELAKNVQQRWSPSN